VIPHKSNWGQSVFYTFQACALNHSATSPFHKISKTYSALSIHQVDNLILLTRLEQNCSQRTRSGRRHRLRIWCAKSRQAFYSHEFESTASLFAVSLSTKKPSRDFTFVAPRSQLFSHTRDRLWFLRNTSTRVYLARCSPVPTLHARGPRWPPTGRNGVPSGEYSRPNCFLPAKVDHTFLTAIRLL